jgi:hypothetical protein
VEARGRKSGHQGGVELIWQRPWQQYTNHLAPSPRGPQIPASSQTAQYGPSRGGKGYPAGRGKTHGETRGVLTAMVGALSCDWSQQRRRNVHLMSALAPKADISLTLRDVRFVP